MLTDECEAAFQELKKRLTTPPILVAPRDEGQYVLDCDTSDTAIGSVIQQFQDGKLHVIAYASRTLSEAERQYCITRQNSLQWCTDSKSTVSIYSGDLSSSALTYLMGTSEPIGQQGRWLDLLAEYDITIQHRLGRVRGNSGALSRCSCERDGGPECRQCWRLVSGTAKSVSVTAMQNISANLSAGKTAMQNVENVVPVVNTTVSLTNTFPVLNTVSSVSSVASPVVAVVPAMPHRSAPIMPHVGSQQ